MFKVYAKLIFKSERTQNGGIVASQNPLLHKRNECTGVGLGVAKERINFSRTLELLHQVAAKKELLFKRKEGPPQKVKLTCPHPISA